MILLIIGYHKEPFATGSTIKRCIFLMTLDKTFKGNCIKTNLSANLGRRTEIQTEPNIRPSLTVYKKLNEPVY